MEGRRGKGWLILLIVAVLAAAVGAAAFLSLRQRESTEYYVSPYLKVTEREGQVAAVEPLNREAGALLSAYDGVGKAADQVLADFLAAAESEGLLNRNLPVYIDVRQEKKTSQKFRGELEAAVAEKLKAAGVSVRSSAVDNASGNFSDAGSGSEAADGARTGFLLVVRDYSDVGRPQKLIGTLTEDSAEAVGTATASNADAAKAEAGEVDADGNEADSETAAEGAVTESGASGAVGTSETSAGTDAELLGEADTGTGAESAANPDAQTQQAVQNSDAQAESLEAEVAAKQAEIELLNQQIQTLQGENGELTQELQTERTNSKVLDSQLQQAQNRASAAEQRAAQAEAKLQQGAAAEETEGSDREQSQAQTQDEVRASLPALEETAKQETQEVRRVKR